MMEFRQFTGKVLEYNDEVFPTLVLYTLHVIDRPELPREGPGWRHIPLPLGGGPAHSTLAAAESRACEFMASGMYAAVCVTAVCVGCHRKARVADRTALVSAVIVGLYLRAAGDRAEWLAVDDQPTGDIISTAGELAASFVVGEVFPRG